MTHDEIKKASQLLGSRTDRIETSVTDNGQCLIAYWLDGSGQKIFYSLDEVEQHIAEHPAIATYVVYRHGSNAANQSRRNKMPVFWVAAMSSDAAKDAAINAGVNCYSNQRLTAEEARDCPEADQFEAQEQTELV